MTTPIRRSGPAGAACTFPGGPVIPTPTARTDQTRRGVPGRLRRLRAAYRDAALDNARAFHEATGLPAGAPTPKGTAR
jgi:hypothetical protein